MDSYDSDDSLSDAESGTTTNVLLGYASKTPTDDSVSQLGGIPTWLDASQHPSPTLAQCKCCSNYLSLLLQLNGDLPERFPNHERRLYIWGCKRKACRRKPGSIRAIRGIRSSDFRNEGHKKAQDPKINNAAKENLPSKPKADIGNALFGGQSQATAYGGNPFSSTTAQNPFSMSSSTNPFSSIPTNPFAAAPGPASTLAAKSPQRPVAEPQDGLATLHATFAAKASISPTPAPTSPPPAPRPQPASLPWPQPDQFSKPYPQYYLDADYEYLSPDSTSQPTANHTAFMDVDAESAKDKGKAAEKEDADLYESAHDKTFQHFADVLAQNPEQVLRYEFGGSPLLYSRSDEVGRLFTPSHNAGNSKITTIPAAGQSQTSNIPKCGNCGASRIFEMQLTPHAIAELEVEEDAATLLAEGMEWGNIILGVCSKDCGSGDGKVDYVEEWAGVQWEEIVSRASGSK